MSGRDVGRAVPAGDQTSVCIWPSDERILVETVSAAGGAIAPAEKAEVLVSFNGDIDFVRRALHPGIRWVQIGSAGVDKWVTAGVIDRERVWTACQGVYAPPIDE